MQWLWLFIPDEALVLVIMLIGLGLMVGVLRSRSAGRLVGGIVLMLLLAPFVESLISALPWWVNLLLLVGLGWAMIRGLSRLFLGARVADHMTGILAADAVRALFRAAFFAATIPFRLIGWVLRRI